MNKENILEQHKDLDRAELVGALLLAEARLRAERKQSKWLDTLADELRYEESHEESDELYQECEDFNSRMRKDMLSKYGLEF